MVGSSTQISSCNFKVVKQLKKKTKIQSSLSSHLKSGHLLREPQFHHTHSQRHLKQTFGKAACLSFKRKLDCGRSTTYCKLEFLSPAIDSLKGPNFHSLWFSFTLIWNLPRGPYFHNFYFTIIRIGWAWNRNGSKIPFIFHRLHLKSIFELRTVNKWKLISNGMGSR